MSSSLLLLPLELGHICSYSTAAELRDNFRRISILFKQGKNYYNISIKLLLLIIEYQPP